MITTFNRAEVFVGQSLQKFNEARQLLEINGIRYRYRLANRCSILSGRETVGIYTDNQEFVNTYYIYVNKKDYEYACGLLHEASD